MLSAFASGHSKRITIFLSYTRNCVANEFRMGFKLSELPQRSYPINSVAACMRCARIMSQRGRHLRQWHGTWFINQIDCKPLNDITYQAIGSPFPSLEYIPIQGKYKFRSMFSTYHLLLVIPILLRTSTSHSLGINCRGSGKCGSSHGFDLANGTNVPSSLSADFQRILLNGTGYLPGGPVAPGTVYQAGQHIACADNGGAGECLFMQGKVPSGGVNASTIIARLGDLDWHGCSGCGSVPLSGDNNPDEMGILTINYVKNYGGTGGCNGLCTDAQVQAQLQAQASSEDSINWTNED